GQLVRREEKPLLLPLAEIQAVIRGWSDEQRRGERSADERAEVHAALCRRDLAEALGEGQREEEGEQDLDAWEGNAELVQQLDQLAVDAVPLVLVPVGLLHLSRSLPRSYP